MIEQTVVQVLVVLRDQSRTAAQRRLELEKIAHARFDFRTMAQLVLARDWKRLDSAKRDECVDQFTTYLANDYGTRLDRYHQEDVKVMGEQPKPHGDVEVRTKIVGGANDGALVEPTLIREIRGPNGTVRYRHRPEPVRRVVTPLVAAKLRDLLRGVVEAGGTAERAALANFQLAAKTGTARRVVGGRYAAGQYTASFAALFPADRPQLVVVMKIDNPQRGSYFAAQTAAPVTRSMLEQALAARTVALDRASLSNVAPAADRAPLDEPDGVVPYVLQWPYVPDTATAQADRVVPNVAGRPLREAARTLHRRGFNVVVKGWGVIHHTWPAAGEHAAAGTTVTMFAEASPVRPSRP